MSSSPLGSPSSLSGSPGPSTSSSPFTMPLPSSPHGPLRILIDLASSRDDDLPTLVYEACPTVAPSSSHPSTTAAIASYGYVKLQPINPPLVDHCHVDRRLIVSARDSNSNHVIIEIENLDVKRSPLMPSTGSSTEGDKP